VGRLLFIPYFHIIFPFPIRIARQEVALQTPHPVRSGKLRGGGLTTGSCIFFKFINAVVDTGSRG